MRCKAVDDVAFGQFTLRGHLTPTPQCSIIHTLRNRLRNLNIDRRETLSVNHAKIIIP